MDNSERNAAVSAEEVTLVREYMKENPHKKSDSEIQKDLQGRGYEITLQKVYWARIILEK